MIDETSEIFFFRPLPVPWEVLVGATEDGRGTAGIDGDAAGVKMGRLDREEIQNLGSIFCGQV